MHEERSRAGSDNSAKSSAADPEHRPALSEASTREPDPEPALQASEAPPSSEQDADDRSPLGWRAVIGLAVLAVVGWFIIQSLVRVTKVQDCVWSGRRNCAPVEDPSPR